MRAKQLPSRLYKFRPFNQHTLDMLVFDRLYFADPSTFNDPLDTKPTLKADIDSDQLETTLLRLLESRFKSEMEAAAKKMSYRGPKTKDHILRRSQRQAQSIITNIRYNATNPDYEELGGDPKSGLLASEMEQELLRRYNRGIFSMAERAECPLMWSHYGDQHRGLAIGYSTPADASKDVFRMKYGGSRVVEASKVKAMLDGDSSAGRPVDEAILLRKARDWSYEREWRLLGDRGVQDSPLEMEEVVFGLRCPVAVQYAVVTAMNDRPREIKFFEIILQNGSFLLRKRRLDIDELKAGLPHRARWWREHLAAFPIE